MAFVERSGDSSWRVRYWSNAGVHASISGFPTRDAAQDKADEIDTDQRRGTFHDPAAGKIALADWAGLWLESLDLAPATMSQYHCLHRCHIQPRWGTTALSDISGLQVHKWAAALRARGLADSTVATIVKVLSMMLADAADERLIPANPIRPQRRGRRRHTRRAEAVWVSPEQALRVGMAAASRVGGWAGILIITAAWTGARWGELCGLRRPNLHLNLATMTGQMVIDPEMGALHEVDQQLFLGPTKTAESGRTVVLPPFLVELLAAHLHTRDRAPNDSGSQHRDPLKPRYGGWARYPVAGSESGDLERFVFLTEDGAHPRRSNFARRAMRPAADGTPENSRATVRSLPIAPGLTFHGLRHSHKTWMIEDGFPDVVQARRLGHVLPDKIQEVYSHVAPSLEARLLQALQTRWTAALDQLHRAPATPATAASHTSTQARPRALNPGAAVLAPGTPRPERTCPPREELPGSALAHTS
jgi:integrase